MIIKEELLQKYKQYLLSFDYPFIKQKSNDDIKKIFEKENRIFLLSWLINKYLPSYENKLENAQKNNKKKELIIQFIYENGFCQLQERDGFVNGTLNDEKQVLIFNRIFYMLSLLYTSNSKEESIKTEEDMKLKQKFMTPTEDLRKEINLESNLLKSLCSPTKMSETERKAEIDFYKESIDNLKNILELSANDEISSSNEISSNFSTSDVEKLVTDFKKLVTEFNFEDFVKFSSNKAGENTISNRTDLENLVSNNSKEINSLIQTLQKKQELNEFISRENTENDDSIVSDDFSSRILQNFVMSNNIIESARRNDKK